MKRVLISFQSHEVGMRKRPASDSFDLVTVPLLVSTVGHTSPPAMSPVPSLEVVPEVSK